MLFLGEAGERRACQLPRGIEGARGAGLAEATQGQTGSVWVLCD